MTSTKTRINKIANVVVPVADQDKALAFYVDQLGFTKTVDQPFGNGYRWIEISLGDEATTIALAPPPDDGPVGDRQTGITLQTSDLDALHAQLKDAGVDVDAEVTRMGGPVPPMFWFRDPEGNSLLVVQ
jgi:predicted enzyme related to lactoylglutathione lyase